MLTGRLIGVHSQAEDAEADVTWFQSKVGRQYYFHNPSSTT